MTIKLISALNDLCFNQKIYFIKVEFNDFEMLCFVQETKTLYTRLNNITSTKKLQDDEE